MPNEYLTQIILAIRETKYDIIMVFKNRLTNEESKFISDVAMEYSKTVLFASMQTMLFNNNKNVLIMKD
ncbi:MULTISPECIES: hypothetical protein [Clostridium]|jgi:hypothetical protein|uniref:Uncharacterized protein n=1 Tax=Clostridium saccharoperbutylacetonicum N1-4(HMT) TaxID=931276 RepID=M1N1N1_9CLOT|nr:MULTISPECIES: hypothetical protein [Clostridium]AGF57392.1 hypothetical protein Cspa_c36310 [Clostridium saccharoperbutylacetonicum N1-4(HMT)]AQR96091.1 hypothetical protein CLSAP_34090 [Clostridium saccharoperbutylacetonicum]NRT61844.1 hypothetical protein [Clostridium saccharoperbutylacetonicum]NSB25170.1 hypothetical protein [Clostridium saccharoperbutylacetonicum]NSB31960.1 hypothetical protein [Clostridium saccharoperbutylacetonicum]